MAEADACAPGVLHLCYVCRHQRMSISVSLPETELPNCWKMPSEFFIDLHYLTTDRLHLYGTFGGGGGIPIKIP